MTEATKCRADRKYKLLRSYRVAIRRQCFSLLKARSIRSRCGYSSRSYSQSSLRFDLGGMIASAPWSLIKARTRSLSYPFVSDDRTGLDTGQQGYGLGDIRPLSAGEGETNRPALGISHQMNPDAQSAAGAAQSLTLAPLCRRPPADGPALRWNQSSRICRPGHPATLGRSSPRFQSWPSG